MYRKRITVLLIFTLITLLAACSGEDSSEEITTEESTSESNTDSVNDSMNKESEDASKSGLSEAAENETEQTQAQKERMMIYEAHIDLETKDFDKFQRNLQSHMNEHEAYMVETNVQRTERGNRQGHIRIRVPQPNFESLLSGFETISDQIKSRNINSRDVTKNYVDLESRLKAKEEIEARLLSFLEEASATEDLVKISQDLERVQADIESLKGEMNYLENQSDFSTITISFTETKVLVGGVDQQDLNTWERTKQAFFNSINGLANVASWLFVAAVGYSPVLVPVLIVIALWIWRRKKRKSRSDEE
ncbi:DUF4349 domain-containing protein [Halobacillus litoralis]|uniref:DUF4349 domain-containing protein n=1 Tax=Halobacillus litoralis TaxID=45668 RepID=A0A845E5W5_9BACI|nr:DUF4349 domain-containing protein [Halobacillus litoralis]MYL51214.1 DUF4349 domain-containing protein [Halobacillus litoralis]